MVYWEKMMRQNRIQWRYRATRHDVYMGLIINNGVSIMCHGHVPWYVLCGVWLSIRIMGMHKQLSIDIQIPMKQTDGLPLIWAYNPAFNHGTHDWQAENWETCGKANALLTVQIVATPKS